MALTDQDRAVLRSFARRIDPSDSGAHNNLGVVYFVHGLDDEAVEQFSRALELDPKMEVAQRNLEIAQKRSGYYERRVTELRERLRTEPDHRDARWELGRAYASLGQYDVAAAEFQALVSQHPDDVAAMIQLALAERQRDILRRYGRDEERICRLIRENFELCRRVEKKIFARLILNPEDLAAMVAEAPPSYFSLNPQ